MKRANIIVRGMRNNYIFRPGVGPNGGDFFLPWQLLREKFYAVGYELNTSDLNEGHSVEFELHLNAQRKVRSDVPVFAYLYEDPLVRPLNADIRHLAKYTKLFTWNENLIDGDRFFELAYPNDIAARDFPGWDDRDLFCVMIASNKALRYPSPRNLHSKRLQIIHFFEKNAPDDFSLYGRGWHIPAVEPGAIGRIKKRINEWRVKWRPAKVVPFPSWCGEIEKKYEILSRSKYSICYENSRGSPGYLTEKIFDCFVAGCVPIYIGTVNENFPIPRDCMIDGDLFETEAELLSFLRSITVFRFAQYQKAIRSFLLSESVKKFSNEYWASYIVTKIKNIL